MQRKRNHRCFKVRYRGLKCNLFLLQSFIQSRHNGSSRLTRAFRWKMSRRPTDRLKAVNPGNTSWTLWWPREILRVCETVYEWNWETKPFSYTMITVQSVSTSATAQRTQQQHRSEPRIHRLFRNVTRRRTTNSSIVQERDSAAEVISDEGFKHVSLKRQSARSRFPSACGHSPHGKTVGKLVLTQKSKGG